MRERLTDAAAQAGASMQPRQAANAIPLTLQHPAAAKFWLALVGTGTIAGVGAAALTRLLETVQRFVWGGTGSDLLASTVQATLTRHVLALLAAGAIVGVGEIVVKRLSSGNGIDTPAAIWLYAGRLPSLRTLGSALLSVIIVGVGASLGREGAPKQAGAVFANVFADKTRYQMSNAVYLLRAAREQGWPPLTGCHSAERSSPWK